MRNVGHECWTITQKPKRPSDVKSPGNSIPIQMAHCRQCEETTFVSMPSLGGQIREC